MVRWVYSQIPGSRSYQGVKVEKDIALPWCSCLALCTALSVYSLSEEQKGLVRPPFLVLGHGVQTCEGRVSRSEPPSQIGRAVVNDERGMCLAVDAIGLCGWLGSRKRVNREQSDILRVYFHGRNYERAGLGPCLVLMDAANSEQVH